MRVTIYQPRYLPQLHYFNRMFAADTFVLLESAQYTKTLVHLVDNKKERHKSFQSNTVIKFPTGTYCLTVPIKHQGLLPINKTLIDYSSGWHKKHVTTIATVYRKAPFFKSIYPSLQQILSVRYNTLAELNTATITWGVAMLLELPTAKFPIPIEEINILLKKVPTRLKKIIRDIDTHIIRPDGLQKGTEWTTAICNTLEADEYMHGETAQTNYMNTDYYNKHGIKLIAQRWHCDPYTQQFVEKAGFVANLSLIDLLCNVDLQTARNILAIE